MTDIRTDFNRGDVVRGGTQGQHVFVATIADRFPVFGDLRTAVNPATGRAYFDIGNASDNLITLRQGAPGTVTASIDGVLTQNGPHPAYSNFSEFLGRAAQQTYRSQLEIGASKADAARSCVAESDGVFKCDEVVAGRRN